MHAFSLCNTYFRWTQHAMLLIDNADRAFRAEMMGCSPEGSMVIIKFRCLRRLVCWAPWLIKAALNSWELSQLTSLTHVRVIICDLLTIPYLQPKSHEWNSKPYTKIWWKMDDFKKFVRVRYAVLWKANAYIKLPSCKLCKFSPITERFAGIFPLQ